MESRKQKVQNCRERFYFFVHNGIFSIYDRIKISELDSLLVLSFHFLHVHFLILLSYVDIP